MNGPTSGFKMVVGLVIGVLVIGLLLIITPFSQIEQSERGVVLKWGKVDRVLEPGMHWVTPIAEDVQKIVVTRQNEEVAATAASKDLQDVTATIAINYTIDATKVAEVWTELRNNYKDVVITPNIQEAVKAATAKYTAEELVTKRESVKADIFNALKVALAPRNIIVNDVLITNFQFSTQFNAAIEAKVKAEQDALKAQNDLARVQFEADQRVATAEAEAQSIRLQSDAANNPRYVELKKVEAMLKMAEKWNGQLPVNIYGSAPIPFLDLGN